MKIADIYDVSLDYLTGRANDPRVKMDEVDGMKIVHNRDSALTLDEIREIRRIIEDKRRELNLQK
jgi:hypothetical protein